MPRKILVEFTFDWDGYDDVADELLIEEAFTIDPFSNLEGGISAKIIQQHSPSGVESAGVWVKASERLPQPGLITWRWLDKEASYSGYDEKGFIYDKGGAHVDPLYHTDIEWLDESAAAPSKDFSQILKDYKQTKDYAALLGNTDKDWTLENLPIGKQETLHALQGYKQMIKDLDAILYCYEEGFEENLAQAIEILKALVGLKELKDSRGKTEYYLMAQPVAWERAKQYLESVVLSTESKNQLAFPSQSNKVGDNGRGIAFGEWILQENYKPYAGWWYKNGNHYANHSFSTGSLYSLYLESLKKKP